MSSYFDSPIQRSRASTDSFALLSSQGATHSHMSDWDTPPVPTPGFNAPANGHRLTASESLLSRSEPFHHGHHPLVQAPAKSTSGYGTSVSGNTHRATASAGPLFGTMPFARSDPIATQPLAGSLTGLSVNDPSSYHCGPVSTGPLDFPTSLPQSSQFGVSQSSAASFPFAEADEVQRARASKVSSSSRLAALMQIQEHDEPSIKEIAQRPTASSNVAVPSEGMRARASTSSSSCSTNSKAAHSSASSSKIKEMWPRGRAPSNPYGLQLPPHLHRLEKDLVRLFSEALNATPKQRKKTDDFIDDYSRLVLGQAHKTSQAAYEMRTMVNRNLQELKDIRDDFYDKLDHAGKVELSMRSERDKIKYEITEANHEKVGLRLLELFEDVESL